MFQQNQSGRNDNLAARQHNNAESHEGQFDDAVESIPQAIQCNNNSTSTTHSAVVSRPFNHGVFSQIVFLDNGSFANSPGNNAATELICGVFSAIYKKLPKRLKKRLVYGVYETLIKKGFIFAVVVNQQGSMHPRMNRELSNRSMRSTVKLYALKYIDQQLREGQSTA